jgi:hypothetical protein
MPNFMNKFARWCLVGLAICAIATLAWSQQTDSSAVSPAPPEMLAQRDGATLEKIQLKKGDRIYLQTLNLQTVDLEQIVGTLDPSRIAQGIYYPGPDQTTSPYFQRLAPPDLPETTPKTLDPQTFSIINGSFFEEYQSSTRLSFPIKLNGKVITAGSSPYGPIPQPADPIYRQVQLKALVWGNGQAQITNYDPSNGSPLNQPTVQNAIVSYAYQDHPAYRLAGDPVNRYHVLGIGSKDGAPQLMIATSDRATLENTAQVLRQRGVEGDLMTFDGGISTYLWSPEAGELILPKVAHGEKTAALPHYLKIQAQPQ